MALSRSPISGQDIIYPDSDGRPMADNTKQFRWIVKLQGGLDAMFSSNPDVFVAGDLLWYPVEGDHKTCTAPDAMVVFGRPKGDRGSYKQWQEDNIPPQVVFEVLSPGNTLLEMAKKFRFYERYGVEEYYLYDPDKGDFSGWLRSNSHLEVIETLSGWVSPRLGIRFELVAGELEIYRTDGVKFASYVELEAQKRQAQQQLQQERQRAEKLATKLKELGIDPDV